MNIGYLIDGNMRILNIQMKKWIEERKINHRLWFLKKKTYGL